MVRITVDIPDADLPQIDAEAKQQNISRSKWAAKAIDLSLHQMCSISDAEVMQLKDQVMQLQKQLDAKTLDCDAKSQKITNLNDELDRIKSQLRNDNNEATQRWEELKSYKSEVTKLKKLLEESQTTNQHLKDDLLKKQNEVDQLTKTREELIAATTARDKLQEALKVREDDIAYFKSHVAQLTQSISQLSLKPGEEEIKKKGWWQFWK